MSGVETLRKLSTDSSDATSLQVDAQLAAQEVGIRVKSGKPADRQELLQLCLVCRP